MMEHYPDRLIMQWHITERCNLHCLHCYRGDEAFAEPDLPELIHVLDRFTSFLRSGRILNQGMKGHINVAGGEPLARKDFMDLAMILSSMSDSFSFGILSNGTLIDIKTAAFLAKTGVSFVQVSLEGMEETHDQMRGNGNFRLVLKAIKNLVHLGLRTIVSFTATRLNYMEFPEIVRLCRRLKVSRLWADRLIPIGSGSILADSCLNPSETDSFIRLMYRARKNSPSFFSPKTDIAMNRALQFHLGGGYPYRCRAGDTLVAVMPDSSVFPCRRMPVNVGNLNNLSLEDVYSCEFFRSLRDRSREIEGCQSCFYRTLCRGGLKCLSYAVHGDPFVRDPGCWV